MTVSEQMHVVLATIERHLSDAGALASHILSIRINLADANDYQEAMRIWTAWASAGRVRARATVGFLDEPHGTLLEVTLVAAFRPDRPPKH